MASEIEGNGKREERESVGGQGLSGTRSGVPRWPGAATLLSIGASYLALSDYVTVVPRFWLPGLMALLVTILLMAHARGHYRLARAISFALLGVVTISLVLREFFLITTLSGRGISAPPSASGAVSETDASTGFLRHTLRRSVDGVLMSVVLAESVGSLDPGINRRISLVYAGLPPYYFLVTRLV